MSESDWRELSPGEGVLVEHSPGDGRTVWWVPAGSDDEFQYWRQLSAARAAETSAGDGFLLTPVTACPVRRRRGGGPAAAPGKAATGKAATESLRPTAPTNPGPVERCGPDRSDLVLLRAARA